MIEQPKQRTLLLLLTGIFLGTFVMLQSRAFKSVSVDYSRENVLDVFQEIKILKDKNKSLEREISSLEETLTGLSDQKSALKAIEEEITKYKKLTGNFPVFGTGISITIDYKLSVPWVIDLVNDVFNSGAEALSINDIRVTNKTAGFDLMPNGGIMINGVPLSEPYVFKAIGDSSSLENILTLPGGILSRIKTSNPNLNILLERKDVVQIN